MMIEDLRELVVKLLEADEHDEADKAWVAAVFVSLRTAEKLGYQEDSFLTLSNKEKHDTLLAIMSEDQLLPPVSSPMEQCWKAGHFYNNALFRIVALAETRLPVLFERDTGVRPSKRLEDYWRLSKWYEKKYAESSLENVNRARAQVNRLKHVPHYDRLEPDAECLKEGIAAFREVITLLERVVEVKPNPGIVIIGWDSVIWDPRNLPREGKWQSKGPKLPIEFSRVSQDCCLTPVIDHDKGTDVETKYVISPRVDIDEAIEDLRVREGTVKEYIGFVDKKHTIASDTAHSNYRSTYASVKSWLDKTEFWGAVWTALPSNFIDETGQDFSVENGVKYLHNLPKSARQQALDYIRKVPKEVDTPLRRKLLELHMLEKCS